MGLTSILHELKRKQKLLPGLVYNKYGMNGQFFLTLFFSFYLCLAFGQQTATERKKAAKEFLANAKYSEALAVLNSSFELSREDEEAQLLIAVCFYQLNNLDKAEQLLQKMLKEEKSDYPESLLYLGKVYHARNEFGNAAKYYKLYLKNIKSNHPNRKLVWNLLKNTAFGQDYLYAKPVGEVDNLGAGVNTEYDEFAPVMSPNYGNKLYFSSIRKGNMGGLRNKYGVADDRFGHYTTDIYSCENDNGVWGKTQGMHFLLNSPQHELLLDFNAEGTALYFYKGNNFTQGQILVDTFKQLDQRALNSDPFDSPFSPAQGDQTPFFVNDTLIYFSSNRPGGYGGYDLYRLEFYNGRWSSPINLGSTINSAYDETTPFMALDGKTLYFSSNNPKWSVGGFDILKAQYNAQKIRWTYPYNLGIPLNSPGDDTHFRLARDGYTGYFSSSRKEGFGQRDLYVIYFEEFLPEQEITYKPIKPSDYQRAEPEPPVVNPELERASEPPSPSEVPPTPKPDYSLQSIYFDTPEIIFEEKNKIQLDQILGLMKKYEGRILLLITAYCSTGGGKGQDLFESIVGAEMVYDYFQQKGISSSDIYLNALEEIPREQVKSGVAQTRIQFRFISLTGDLPMEITPLNPVNAYGGPGTASLFYKVQIASLTGPYKDRYLNDFSNPMVEKHPTKDFYRYTVGQFISFSEVKDFLKKVKSAGAQRAFIVPYIQGIRVSSREAQELKSTYPDLQNYLINN